nr:trypsin CFT-1-like [Maniola hyperantus]
MKTIVLLLAIGLTTVASLPQQHERIIGGSVTNINNYPFAGSLQITTNNVQFRHNCGCTIINNRSMLSAAHCWPRNAAANRYRARVGSTNVSSGGRQLNVAQLIGHPSYNSRNHDNDVGVIRVSTAIPIGSASIRAGSLAGANLNIPDNANVIAIGWGLTSVNGSPSESLRHVGLQTVNQARCQSIYGGGTITANMLCAIWPAGGRGSCFGDSGTALLRSNVVVGVTSFGAQCASAHWPGVYARVSRYVTWIRNNS